MIELILKHFAYNQTLTAKHVNKELFTAKTNSYICAGKFLYKPVENYHL